MWVIVCVNDAEATLTIEVDGEVFFDVRDNWWLSKCEYSCPVECRFKKMFCYDIYEK